MQYLESSTKLLSFVVVIVQLLSPSNSLWLHELQASLCFTVSQSLLRFMSIESALPFNHLILCLRLLLLLSIFPSFRLFSNELAVCISGQSSGASSLSSGFPMNIQGWFPLGLTGLISLQPKGLSRILSSTTIWKHQFFGIHASLWPNSHIHMTTGKSIALTICTFVIKVVSLLFITLSKSFSSKE